MQDVIAYFSTHGADYIQMVLEHLNVSILSLAMAILIAVPLGIACSRSPLLEKVSVGVSGILRIIPSLAVLVVCVPILGTGTLPAVVALTVLAIPPILINTALGFRSVPADVLEAARGMGMDERLVFLKIKVPLAFAQRLPRSWPPQRLPPTSARAAWVRLSSQVSASCEPTCS